ncbi:MAG TPA: outer membrane protein [Candidatus Binatia bacterium]|nr:outer membrane protein [Candidatus Binatia bacterium]
MLSVVFASGALAADMPVKARPIAAAPAFNWTGFYIGGNVGAAWQNSSTNFLSLPFGVGAPADPFQVNGSRAHFAGGVHAGYNFQFSGNWVVGAEIDFSLLSNSANRNVRQATITGGTPVAGDFITTEDKTDWLASARARLGYAITPNWLVYGTLGGAWSRHSYEANEINTVLPFSATVGKFHKDATGVAAGGGFEYAMTQNLILRAEYLYYGVGKTVTAVAPCVGACAGVGPDVFTWRTTDIQQVRAGLSYKF